jgi:hypothetical protein
LNALVYNTVPVTCTVTDVYKTVPVTCTVTDVYKTVPVTRTVADVCKSIGFYSRSFSSSLFRSRFAVIAYFSVKTIVIYTSLIY